VTRVIDDERRQQFMDEGAHFESDYFLTLTYLPPIETEEKVKGWMFEGRNGNGGSGVVHQILERFKSRVEMFENVFSALFRTERLTRHEFLDDHGFPHVRDKLLQYLRRCVGGEDHPFALPEIPVYLNDLLATQDFCAGIEPRVGRKHVRVIALDGFPKSSFPGVLGEIDSLPMEYRWSTRAILLDPEEARSLLDKSRRKWRSRIRGFKDQVLKTHTAPGRTTNTCSRKTFVSVVHPLHKAAAPIKHNVGNAVIAETLGLTLNASRNPLSAMSASPW
jgi:type IV secretion system protein VirB4